MYLPVLSNLSSASLQHPDKMRTIFKEKQNIKQKKEAKQTRPKKMKTLVMEDVVWPIESSPRAALLLCPGKIQCTPSQMT